MNKGKPVIEVESEEDDDPQSKEEIQQQIQLERQQLELLLDLVEQEVLPSYAVTFMIELGVLSLDDDLLPCQQRGRHNHWADYHHLVKKYRERQRDPPPPRPAPTNFEEQMEAWREDRLSSPPNSGEYTCPLLALDEPFGEAPRPIACVEARRLQRRWPGFLDEPERQQQLDDPEDPVNQLQLRPCRVLGVSLSDSIFVTLARRRREAEARRWPAGKPKA